MKHLLTVCLLAVMALGSVGCLENLRDPADPVLTEMVEGAAFMGGYLVTAGILKEKEPDVAEVQTLVDVVAAIRIALDNEAGEEATSEAVDYIIDRILEEVEDDVARAVCRAIIPVALVNARQNTLSGVLDADAAAWATLALKASRQALRGIESAASAYVVDHSPTTIPV